MCKINKERPREKGIKLKEKSVDKTGTLCRFDRVKHCGAWRMCRM